SGNTIVTATISVTPAANSCTGAAVPFTITVNPTPTLVQPQNQTLCSGSPTSVSFAGDVSGTVLNWTNSNPAIGLGASGLGDIGTFNLLNSGNSIISSTITVTPGANGCTGSSKSFTITVNPTPTLNPTSNQTLC